MVEFDGGGMELGDSQEISVPSDLPSTAALTGSQLSLAYIAALGVGYPAAGQSPSAPVLRMANPAAFSAYRPFPHATNPGKPSDEEKPLIEGSGPPLLASSTAPAFSNNRDGGEPDGITPSMVPPEAASDELRRQSNVATYRMPGGMAVTDEMAKSSWGDRDFRSAYVNALQQRYPSMFPSDAGSAPVSSGPVPPYLRHVSQAMAQPVLNNETAERLGLPDGTHIRLAQAHFHLLNNPDRPQSGENLFDRRAVYDDAVSSILRSSERFKRIHVAAAKRNDPSLVTKTGKLHGQQSPPYLWDISTELRTMDKENQKSEKKADAPSGSPAQSPNSQPKLKAKKTGDRSLLLAESDHQRIKTKDGGGARRRNRSMSGPRDRMRSIQLIRY